MTLRAVDLVVGQAVVDQALHFGIDHFDALVHTFGSEVELILVVAAQLRADRVAAAGHTLQSDSQHHRLRDRVKRVTERDGYSAARLLRLGRLLNTIAATFAVSGTELREQRVAPAEHGCAEQQ